jgi:hypothetical protein
MGAQSAPGWGWLVWTTWVWAGFVLDLQLEPCSSIVGTLGIHRARPGVEVSQRVRWLDDNTCAELPLNIWNKWYAAEGRRYSIKTAAGCCTILQYNAPCGRNISQEPRV